MLVAERSFVSEQIPGRATHGPLWHGSASSIAERKGEQDERSLLRRRRVLPPRTIGPLGRKQPAQGAIHLVGRAGQQGCESLTGRIIERRVPSVSPERPALALAEYVGQYFVPHPLAVTLRERTGRLQDVQVRADGRVALVVEDREMLLTFVGEQYRSVHVVAGPAERQQHHGGIVCVGYGRRGPADPFCRPVVVEVPIVWRQQFFVTIEQAAVVQVVE